MRATLGDPQKQLLQLFRTQVRAEFIDSLEDAQAQINAGNFMEYEPDAFKNWLLDTYRGDGK
jgi:hypothetical protein